MSACALIICLQTKQEFAIKSKHINTNYFFFFLVALYLHLPPPYYRYYYFIHSTLFCLFQRTHWHTHTFIWRKKSSATKVRVSTSVNELLSKCQQVLWPSKKYKIYRGVRQIVFEWCMVNKRAFLLIWNILWIKMIGKFCSKFPFNYSPWIEAKNVKLKYINFLWKCIWW